MIVFPSARFHTSGRSNTVMPSGCTVCACFSQPGATQFSDSALFEIDFSITRQHQISIRLAYGLFAATAATCLFHGFKSR